MKWILIVCFPHNLLTLSILNRSKKQRMKNLFPTMLMNQSSLKKGLRLAGYGMHQTLFVYRNKKLNDESIGSYFI